MIKKGMLNLKDDEEVLEMTFLGTGRMRSRYFIVEQINFSSLKAFNLERITLVIGKQRIVSVLSNWGYFFHHRHRYQTYAPIIKARQTFRVEYKVKILQGKPIPIFVTLHGFLVRRKPK
jgi:hypothetical protein